MLAIIAGLACLSVAAAQGVGVDLRPYNLTAAIIFVQADQNVDKSLSKEEFTNDYKRYDFNGDGIIERHEYVCYITKSNSYLANVAHAWYDRYDHDHDHHLRKDDFDYLFNEIDTDHDGAVSDAEFVHFFEDLLLKTEKYSLHGNHHQQHNDRYCLSHGHAHG